MYWLRRPHFNYKTLFKKGELEGEEGRKGEGGGGGDAHMHRDVDYVCYTPFDLWCFLLAPPAGSRRQQEGGICSSGEDEP